MIIEYISVPILNEPTLLVYLPEYTGRYPDDTIFNRHMFSAEEFRERVSCDEATRLAYKESEIKLVLHYTSPTGITQQSQVLRACHIIFLYPGPPVYLCT